MARQTSRWVRTGDRRTHPGEIPSRSRRLVRERWFSEAEEFSFIYKGVDYIFRAVGEAEDLLGRVYLFGLCSHLSNNGLKVLRRSRTTMVQD